MTDTVIHLIGFASQPDIQFTCDKRWDVPAWNDGRPKMAPTPGVYLSEGGRAYTFDATKTTCEECKRRAGAK